MRRSLCILLATLAMALTGATTAQSGTGRPLPTFGALTGIPQLDAAASDVAGHPVSVQCVFASSLWLSLVGNGMDGSYVDGFTEYPVDNVIHLGPGPCEALYGLTIGDDVGAVEAARGIFVLAHESVHQRGVIDEGTTDCTALPLVAGLATKFFGVPSTAQQTETGTRSVVVRFAKKTKRVTVTYAKSVSAPNPYLAQLDNDALRWHQFHPSAYQGNC